MADEEHRSADPPVVPGPTPPPSRVVLGSEATVRMSMRPPSRFASGGDFGLWLKRFELYAKRAAFPKEHWTRELVPLLEDEPFRVVDQLGLTESTDYDAVVARLKQQFAPSGNEFEWQLRFQNRVQDTSESMVEFAGSLRMLADRAYPSWTVEQRKDVLRSQFIHGVRSASVQLHLMKEQPPDLDEALELAVKHEAVESAQKRLYKEKKRAGSETQSLTVIEEQDTVNAVASDAKVDMLTRKVQELSEEIARLRGSESRESRDSGPTRNMDVICWNCRGHGHIRRNCPKRGGRPSANWKNKPRSGVDTASVSSILFVSGAVEGKSMPLLVDTGSGMTIVREDVLQDARTNDASPKILKEVGHPVLAANGEELDVAGQAVLTITLGKFTVDHPVLVVRDLTQSCLLGADFLQKYHCIIDLQEKTLTVGGSLVRFLSVNSFTKGVCHVTCPETIVIPSYSQMQLPMLISRPEVAEEAEEAILEPSAEFTQRRGVLVAHCLMSTGSDNASVRILNPSSSPVTLYKAERVGQLFPTAGVLHTYSTTLEGGDPSNQAIERLVHDAENLPHGSKPQLEALLTEFSDIISTGAGDLGRTSLTRHCIDTGEAPPIRQPPRRLPLQQREQVKVMVDDMLSKGIIEPAHGPWASPIVLVRKKDGSTRFCVDFRKVNEVTRKDAQPLPRIDDTIDALEGAKWFSTLDLASGYWQVEVDPRDREKTAFPTPYGLYQFRVMPFGLCNAPGTFQRLMEQVLTGLHWTSCLVYLDDIIIFSKTIEDHLGRLRDVFSRLRAAGLKVKPSKCHLLRRKVQYLGHIISENGVATDPEKTNRVAEWPTPAGAKDLQKFLGLASYYRKFIRNFAHIAAPLHRLTGSIVGRPSVKTLLTPSNITSLPPLFWHFHDLMWNSLWTVMPAATVWGQSYPNCVMGEST